MSGSCSMLATEINNVFWSPNSIAFAAIGLLGAGGGFLIIFVAKFSIKFVLLFAMLISGEISGGTVCTLARYRVAATRCQHWHNAGGASRYAGRCT